jgi:outer membrane protein OmpA-like peptidoglycan-associated protein
MKTTIFVACALLGGSIGCGKDKQPVTQAPANKPLGAPPEDMPDGVWQKWEQKIEERERERANRPPPEIQIHWPAAIETDLAEFNGWWIILKGRVGFSEDHKQVTPKARAVLDEVVFILSETPRIKKIQIQSHRHSRMETNGQNVTQLRANTVKMYLVAQGVDAARIDAKGHADSMPIETNTSELGRRANTRVEIIVRQIDEHMVNTDQ